MEPGLLMEKKKVGNLSYYVVIIVAHNLHKVTHGHRHNDSASQMTTLTTCKELD